MIRRVLARDDQPADPPRVLVLSASIGEGHDLPARVLASEVGTLGGQATVRDGLAAMGSLVEQVVLGGSAFESRVGNVAFDASYALITHIPPTRWLFGRIGLALGQRGLLALIADERPDVIVSTYPGVTEVLGRLRQRRDLAVPVVSAITDLAALRYWSHPGVDLHLVTHPESIPEVRSIAGPACRVVAARGLNDPAFAQPRERRDARRALDLPLDGPIVVVSGGGWGIGDLAGAIETALATDAVEVVVMCGRNESLLERLAAGYGREPRLRLLGFTTEVPDLFAAADVLIHSTAGLTVLEAHVRGCAVISYGWGRGHIRANNRAYERHGIARVARDRTQLVGELEAALATRPLPDSNFATLPSAAELVLDEASGRMPDLLSDHG